MTSSGFEQDDLNAFIDGNGLGDIPHIFQAGFSSSVFFGSQVFPGWSTWALVRSDGSGNAAGQEAPMPALLIADALSTGRPTPTTAISAARDFACALKPGGVAQCWGLRQSGVLDGPDGAFTMISETCAPHYLLTSRDECWGTSQSSGSGPTATLAEISVGSRHACAITTGGNAVCWGGAFRRGQSDPPAGSFTAISSGDYFSCGVRTGGAIACWGSNSDGQSDPPAGSFTAISSGVDFSCGIRLDETIACWGRSQYQTYEFVDGTRQPNIDVRSNQLDAPEGTFRAISVATNSERLEYTTAEDGSHVRTNGAHSCGIRTDGTVACWGGNKWGQLNSPGGTFASVAAGTNHSCGIRRNGAIECWGSAGFSSPQPPSGVFTHIALSGAHSYAIRLNGDVEYLRWW